MRGGSVRCLIKRFGPDEWLTPALDETLKTLPHQGVKKVVVITPGFVSNCVETLEEIEDENYNYFIENGGEQFDYIHPFNDDDDFIALLASLVKYSAKLNQDL
ncbi:ferrochelatase (plasmid) [Vagococcus lutrae]|uniref:ferrochelatase n=1 Tax=Vagococcus lutrae TaxID=81947 RepID=UPI00232EB632|nr:ferrochelatase [Vagococcus lutrae]WCG06122.1 ferrochelatase [Vagococcus lutrae]